ncbi:hypothetical protein [Aquabacterium sp.]|uniref:hypothetical protein n=1 Tax=Aquabacterium sp. TaxID=1872578 RepID=UPI003D6D661F
MRFSSITLQADDADGEGGVFAPGGITVGGKTYTFADPAGSTPQAFAVDGLDLVGQDLQITLQHRAGSAWTFVSEVTFEATAVPEASSAALVLAGLMTTVGVLARRKAQPRNAVTFEAAA